MNAPAKLTQMNAPTKPRTDSPDPAVARLLACHDRQPADQRHGPGNGQAVPGSHQRSRGRRAGQGRGLRQRGRRLLLNHSDFTAKLEDLTSLPEGPTGLPPWPDFLVRLTRLPVASIALIRGRATGNGSEITLACDMSFASREKTIISQWEVGVGMVAGGGPMARLPRLIGRNRALEVLLSSEDIRADQAEAYGYINRALPDADLDAFVEALATGSPSSTNGRSPRPSASSTPACRRTSSSAPDGMRASLRSGDLPPRRGSRR
jgi:hypothetical protein